MCGLCPRKTCHIFSAYAKQLILPLTVVLSFWYPRFLVSSTCEHGHFYRGHLVSAPRMPCLTDLNRTCAMGQLQAGVLQTQVAALFGVSPATISKLKPKSHIIRMSETGREVDVPRRRQHKKTVPSPCRQSRTIGSLLQYRFGGCYSRLFSTQTIWDRLQTAKL